MSAEAEELAALRALLLERESLRKALDDAEALIQAHFDRLVAS